MDWSWDTYGRDYALSLASLFVATIVGLAVIYTLILTKNSLELTRATQRPFLNVEGGVTCRIYTKSIGQIVASINNKGNFPANEVSVSCEVHRIKENATDIFSIPFQVGNEYYPSYCFPNDDVRYFFEKAGIEMEDENKLEIYLTIEYKNQLTGTKYKTIRAYSFIFKPSDWAPTLPSYPQGDYWD